MKRKYIVPIIILCACTGTMQSWAQTKYSLEDCKQMAVENNRTIKNSRLEIEAAKQTKKSAFTNYFPKVSATGMGFRFNNPLLEYNMPGGNLPVYDGNPANLPAATQFAYFPGISLSLLDKATIGAVTAVQPVFAGGRIVTGNKLARLGVNVNNSRLILSKSEVLLQTEEQYWLIVSLNEKLKTLHMVEMLLDTVYKQADNAYRAGLINRNDVMKVSIKQSEMKMNQLKLENGIKLATMAFSQYIGLAYDSTMVLSDTLIISQNPYEVYLDADQAVLNREEYKLLQKSVEAEELQTRLKIGEYLPEVGVGVGAVYYDYDFSNNKGTSNTMVFASVKIPISDWWGASHDIKEKKYKEQIARNNSQNNTELLLLQIQKAWNELNEAYKQIDVAHETMVQAEENLRINSDNYENGIVNISDMLEAQAMLQQTKDDLTDARSGYRIKFVTYLQVTGRY
ncbi:TolC family protein [Proteiniphilum sp.]|uniref:TolC family protein n=1 Tax=Proteiniphilum sp. TaxID=1926877 RepID=UPI002B1FE588|nr:TolC family protein [Proteiniphilum sp.]MEA4918440.1 TolC family protein [Proteiniphilum sp.]